MAVVFNRCRPSLGITTKMRTNLVYWPRREYCHKGKYMYVYMYIL